MYSISTFALSVMSYLDINKKPLSLQHIRDNWEMHPIIDIKAFDNDECASDYSPLINRVWPGSYQGCFDQATDKFT